MRPMPQPISRMRAAGAEQPPLLEAVDDLLRHLAEEAGVPERVGGDARLLVAGDGAIEEATKRGDHLLGGTRHRGRIRVLAQHVRDPLAAFPVVVQQAGRLPQPGIERASPTLCDGSKKVVRLPGAAHGEEQARESDERRDVVREEIEEDFPGDLRLDPAQARVDLLPIEGH